MISLRHFLSNAGIFHVFCHYLCFTCVPVICKASTLRNLLVFITVCKTVCAIFGDQLTICATPWNSTACLYEQQHPFYGPFSSTTRVSWYQKKTCRYCILTPLLGCCNSLSDGCVTTSWLAAATQMRAREPNVSPQHFMLDAFPLSIKMLYNISSVVYFRQASHYV